MEDKEDDKKQGSCEQRWSHKFVNDTWPREKRRQPKVRDTTSDFSQARLMTKTSVFPIDIESYFRGSQNLFPTFGIISLHSHN